MGPNANARLQLLPCSESLRAALLHKELQSKIKFMEAKGVALGYKCFCGKRVTVFLLKRGESNQLPHCVSVSCANGHPATFAAKHVGLLELWADEDSAMAGALGGQASRKAA